MKNFIYKCFVLCALAFFVLGFSSLSYAVEKTDEVVTSPKAKPYTPMPYVGVMKRVEVGSSDTMLDIARRHNLGYVEIMAANPNIDPWVPKVGANVLLPTQHIIPDAPQEGLIVNLADMRIYVFNQKTKEPSSYPIGIGRQGMKTPTGRTTIVNKKEGPWWRPTPRMREEDPTLDAVVKDGPKNPLGTHALYLGWPEYLIHGTNEEWGIGRRTSSGCMRLYPEDIKKVFDLVPVGAVIHVIDQPYKAAWYPDGELYLEVHPNKDQALAIEDGEKFTNHIDEGFALWLRSKAGSEIDRLDWDLVWSLLEKRPGYPVKVTKPKS
jgi:L,D-transpeptidase ErfK/SrfK